MADIDNMRGDTLRVVEENTLDNMRGVTQRVISENSIDNTRGVTYRVYNVNGGSTPVIDELNVTPSTSAQVITAPSGTDGYSPVNVSAVTSAIDANITAGNIKKDVSILGVTGSYEGNVPTGTMYIISNGTYNVADKAIANVQVPTTAPAHYVTFGINNNGEIISGLGATTAIDLTGCTLINTPYLFTGAYRDNTLITGSINMSDVKVIGGTRNICENMFFGCTGITSVDLSSLTTVSSLNGCAAMFYNCTGITSVDLSSLTTVSGNSGCNGMFNGCTGIASVDLSSLTTVSSLNGCAAMFYNCTGLTSVDLSSLTTVSGGNACNSMFGNTSLTSLSFPSLTSASFGTQVTQFVNLLQDVTGCTIHFPSNLDPAGGSTVISSLTTYPAFGGTNTVLAFDLPATE